MAAMTIQKLRALIACLPDDAPVQYKDPNFSGKYHEDPTDLCFRVEEGALRISFPFESEVE
jgi:hypothetical protein